MATKKIFKKKKKIKKTIYKILFFFIIFIFFYYFIFYNKNIKYIIVPENENTFYIIPKDRGGEKVENLDKKSLNLKLEQEFVKISNQPENIYFSIQFYTDNKIEIISKYLKKLTYSGESIYNISDFYIMALNSEIGTEYFLLYKSFETRELANKYCVNYLSLLDRCLIVDTTKF